MRTVVAKFGGTSLADAGHFKRIREIIAEDPDRRFIVVSAPGKRFDGDVKVTDLLLACCDAANKGDDFAPTLGAVRASTCARACWPNTWDSRLWIRNGASASTRAARRIFR